MRVRLSVEISHGDQILVRSKAATSITVQKVKDE